MRYTEGYTDANDVRDDTPAVVVARRPEDVLGPSPVKVRLQVVEKGEPDLRPGNKVLTIDDVPGEIYTFPFKDDTGSWCVVVDDVVWAVSDLMRVEPPEVEVGIKLRGTAMEVAEMRRLLQRVSEEQPAKLIFDEPTREPTDG